MIFQPFSLINKPYTMFIWFAFISIPKSYAVIEDSPISYNLCCPQHHYLNTTVHGCQKSQSQLFPKIYNKDGEDIEGFKTLPNKTQWVSCRPSLLPEPEIRLLETGQLLVENPSYTYDFPIRIEPNDFCIMWQDETSPMAALICYKSENAETEQQHVDTTVRNTMEKYVFPALMGISALFLIVTFVIYWRLSDLNNLLTKCFMASIFMLVLFNISSVLAVTIPIGSFCTVMGLTFHISFLSAFCWLNIISIIVFISLWFRGKAFKCLQRRWFVVCCLYAFGIPLIILSLILIHDYTTSLDHISFYKPGFGIGTCGFSNREAQFFYFYVPVAILLAINLLLFILSVIKLNSQKTSVTVYQICLNMKLLLLMGIPWIFELLTFFFMNKEVLSPATIVWYTLITINACQGILIFLVFGLCTPLKNRRYTINTKNAEDNAATEALSSEFKLDEE